MMYTNKEYSAKHKEHRDIQKDHVNSVQFGGLFPDLSSSFFVYASAFVNNCGSVVGASIILAPSFIAIF